MEDLEKKYRYLQEELLSQQAMFVQTQGYLADLKFQLEKKVEERTIELETINTEIVTLLYRASHDFKAPVASLKGLLNILQTQTRDDFSLEIISKAFDTLKVQENLFHHLNYYHFVKTKNPFSSFINIKNLSEKVLNDMLPSNPQLEKSVFLEIEDNLNFYTSPFHLELILKILIDNALIFSDGNNVRVTAKILNEQLKITVSDSGEGISSAIAHDIYNMFFRGSPKSKGNGLGLFIAKNALEKIRGTICFETSNEGTDFNIILNSLEGND